MPHPQSHLGCPIHTRSLRMSGVEAAPRDDTLIPSHPRRYQLPFPKRICLYRSSPHLTPNAVISILSEAEGPCTLPPQWRDPCIGFLLLPLLLLLLFSIPQESAVAFALLVSIPEGNLRLPLLSQTSPQTLSSRPEAAHFAAAVERSPYWFFAFAVVLALAFLFPSPRESASVAASAVAVALVLLVCHSRRESASAVAVAVASR